MLKFTSIVGYTSCGPTYIDTFLTIFGQCINVLNYNMLYKMVVTSESMDEILKCDQSNESY